MPVNTMKKPSKKPVVKPSMGKKKPEAPKKKMADKPTVLTFLLDETASMSGIRAETIQGFNTYLNEQKKVKGELEVTLIKFDSVDPFNVVFADKAIKSVPELTMETYTPRGNTPLIDASYRAILQTENHVAKIKTKPNVLVVIQTDGEENCSKEHTTEELKQLIEKKQGEGWVFVFMGAGINSYASAQKFGFQKSHTSSYARNQSADAFNNLGDNTTMFRNTGMGASMNYTGAQLSAQGDAFTGLATGGAMSKQDPKKLKQSFTKA